MLISGLKGLNRAKLAVKGLEYLLSRTIIASNNGVK